jgi:GNAT superfamily N-acetyltransferase
MESNRQFLDAFSALARGFASGDVQEQDGVTAMLGRVPVFIFNAFGLRRAVDSAEVFAQRLEVVQRIAKSEGVPCFLGVCEEMLEPAVLAEADAVADRFQMTPIMAWTGMVCEELTPAPTLDCGLEFRPVEDRETRIAVNDINSHAYGMPCEPGREAYDSPMLWAGMYGVVGYQDGAAVATATAFPIGDSVYVAMVATELGHRRKGYAEACMRQAIARATAASGLTRSSLHATPMGHPVYLRMGYRDLATFRLYAEHD